ncbi:MAG TPA: hypothetical protein VIJ55_06995 [Acetobacteraceae bacterium]
MIWSRCEADPARIGREPGEGRALAVIGQKGVQLLAHPGVEAICDRLQCRVVVRGAGRAHDPVEAVSAGPNNPVASEPPADLLLQRRGAQLARERFVGQPTAEHGRCVIVEGCDGKVVEDHPAVPATGAARPVIPVESIRSAANLPSEVRHHRRRQIGFVIGEAPLLTPERELRGQSELAGAGEASQ